MLMNVATVGLKETVAGLRAMPETVQAAIRRAVERQTLALQEHVQRDKLSGQVLHVVTGALRRSIHSTQSEQGAVFRGEVASSGDVKYGAIHEFGGTTKAHDIYPKNAKALHFFAGGNEIFAKVVHHPGSRMPERSFLRSALGDRAQAIEDDIRSSTESAVARVGEA